MRQLSILIVILFFAIGSKAQQAALYECIYKYDVQGKNKSGTSFLETYHGILQIGTTIAKFFDYSSFGVDSLTCQENIDEKLLEQYKLREMKNEYYFDQTVYQNYPTGKMTILSVITPDYYIYEEPLDPIEWSLSEETDTICGYRCKKATGEYGGRKWTAWYTAEIPVQFGPWKFTGLPGLILAAFDSEKIHQFSAISFRKATSPITSIPRINLIRTTREQFVKAKNRFEEDPMNNLPVEAISEMNIHKFGDGPNDKSAFINGVQLRLRPNGYTPLEIQ